MNNRILVVDDTPANIQVLSATLKERGYQISVATNGRQALEVLKRVTPDLILLDVMMPDMDGFETCQELKKSEEWRNIPVIFLTARTDVADIVKGFELGAVDYVAKPFNSHELLARVTTHLTLDELRRTLAAKNLELARAHELVRRAFGRYVSEEVANSILQSPEGLELGGEERDVTILMSDLRGFTAMAARLTPPRVIQILNVYLETMVDVISRYEGTINEILGDAIVVIFGAPLPCADHPAKALACAMAMQLAMERVNLQLAARGDIGLEMGIGVHTGSAVVGNIGTSRRTKYTAIGSTVNLAARVEAFTTGGQVLISEETRQRITCPLRTARQFEVQPKGAAHKLQLHEVDAIGAPYDLSLPSTLSALVELPAPMPVRVAVLEEKFVGPNSLDGQLVAVSETRAAIEIASTVLQPLGNLHMELAAVPGLDKSAEIYAKVIGPADGAPGSTLVRFTAVPAEVQAWLRKIVGNLD